MEESKPWKLRGLFLVAYLLVNAAYVFGPIDWIRQTLGISETPPSMYLFYELLFFVSGITVLILSLPLLKRAPKLIKVASVFMQILVVIILFLWTIAIMFTINVRYLRFRY